MPGIKQLPTTFSERVEQVRNVLAILLIGFLVTVTILVFYYRRYFAFAVLHQDKMEAVIKVQETEEKTIKAKIAEYKKISEDEVAKIKDSNMKKLLSPVIVADYK